MENPFELISERLEKIETLLEQLVVDKEAVQEEPEKLLNAQEAADFLGDALATLYGRTSKNEIPFYKRGKKLYFKKADLIGWIEEGKCKSVSEIRKNHA
ncbi:MAG: hypothetical protein Tsb0034_20180 [Ekhidna sp.]